MQRKRWALQKYSGVLEPAEGHPRREYADQEQDASIQLYWGTLGRPALMPEEAFVVIAGKHEAKGSASRVERTVNLTAVMLRMNMPHPKPGLVKTKKWSGRMQTGCVGGCWPISVSSPSTVTRWS